MTIVEKWETILIILCLAFLAFACVGTVGAAPLSAEDVNLSINLSESQFTKDWINDEDTTNFFTGFAMSIINELVLYSPVGYWTIFIFWLVFIGCVFLYTADIGMTSITMILTSTLFVVGGNVVGIPLEVITIAYLMMGFSIAVILWAAVSRRDV